MDLDELRRLLAAATPGPWETALLTTDTDPYEPFLCVVGDHDADPGQVIAERWNERDAALIVALRNAAPALLDELERLRAVVEAADALAEYEVNILQDGAFTESRTWQETKREVQELHAAYRAARGQR